jgi:hypothetical protein
VRSYHLACLQPMMLINADLPVACQEPQKPASSSSSGIQQPTAAYEHDSWLDYFLPTPLTSDAIPVERRTEGGKCEGKEQRVPGTQMQTQSQVTITAMAHPWSS